MKHLLLTITAAVLLVGCGKLQSSSTPAETEPVAEVTQSELFTAKAPDVTIRAAAAIC